MDPIERIRVPWSEVDELPGRDFTSRWIHVAPEIRALFERASYIDLNEHRLAGFPTDLIEGFHLLSLLDHLANGVLSIDDPGWSGLNYGFDRVRFVSPVHVGDRFRLIGHVESVTSKGDARLVRLRCALEVEGGSRPAVAADWLVYWMAEGA